MSVEGYATNGVLTKYVDAIREVADCTPILLPADSLSASEFNRICDGILLTGSPSNVHPSHYQDDAGDVDFEIDLARDSATLPMIPAALEIDMPLLAICRGHQELNVALGGSLRTDLRESEELVKHYPDEELDVETQFKPSHEVKLEPGGKLQELLGQSRIMVNSYHKQAIDKLADSLVVEGVSPDGIIEAVAVKDRSFVVGVQWHPEWDATTDSVSRQLFEAFGAACRNRA